MAIALRALRPIYVATAAAFVCFLVVQYLSNSGALGLTNAEVSALFPTSITPSGWAFSIWGIVFMGQLLACVYVFVPSRTENSMVRDPLAVPILIPRHYFLLSGPVTLEWPFCPSR